MLERTGKLGLLLKSKSLPESLYCSTAHQIYEVGSIVGDVLLTFLA